MRTAKLDEAQTGIKIARRSINNLRYADDTTHGRKWRGTEEPLDKSEREEWKNWLKTQHSQNKDRGIWSYHLMANRRWQTLFWGAPKSLQVVTVAMKLKNAAPWKKSYDQPRQHIKKQRCYFASKGMYSQSYDLSSYHVWMWELDHKESWVPKNWCLWSVVWRTLLRVPWTARD